VLLSDTINGKPRSYWEAFAGYLAREKRRHRRDIACIDNDLAALSDLGIQPIDCPDDWIQVPGKHEGEISVPVKDLGNQDSGSLPQAKPAQCLETCPVCDRIGGILNK
jgi:uncharacterized protein YjiS (DUF1127 family)